MRIRPYIPGKDYSYLEKWVENEKIHAFWCANRLPYPVTEKDFHAFLEKNAVEQTDGAYVATEDDGRVVGFFCYSIQTETNTGFLKYVLVDASKRGKGVGKEMLRLALQYAFDCTGADSVQLHVFAENSPAKRCYETIGFVEKSVDKEAFAYKDQMWSRCRMVLFRQNFQSPGRS